MFLSAIAFPADTFVIFSALLMMLGIVALRRSTTRQVAPRKISNPLSQAFPSGNVQSLTQPDFQFNNMTTGLLTLPAAPLTPRPVADLQKGPAIARPLATPQSYGGPVIIEGSKYLWESKWSHLPTFEQGREGEERVVNTLVNTLGAGWYIFRNFVLPTINEDIDVVLVGPSGIFAIEVKTYTGDVKFERGRCYVKTGQGRLYRQKRGPNGQVRANAMRLSRFLKEGGIGRKNYVKPLVVIAGDGEVEIVSSGTDVCSLQTLQTKVLELTRSTEYTAEQVSNIARVLQTATGEQMRSGLSRVH